MNKDGDIEAEHKIIFVFGGLYAAFMIVAFFIASLRQNKNLWMLVASSFFIAISFAVGCCIWKIKNKKLWMLDLTILLHFLCLITAFYFVFDNEIAAYLSYSFEIMTTTFCFWWLSYMFNPAILPTDYKNVYNKKIGRFFLKLLMVAVFSLIVFVIQVDANGSMITAILTIIISLVGTKEFFYMVQIFSSNLFSDVEIAKLIEKMDGRLTRIKILILLLELSYILSICLFNFFDIKNHLIYLSKRSVIKQNDIVIDSTAIHFVIEIVILIFLMISLRFLLRNVYSKIFKKLSK
ncbi:hypothetical protein [Apilactobacillus zhangqiuensis]|uniref:hypothetical protein n=1 Tax=Apilactobacillus zhangqiuensis TaxID=2841031 RepID=UPI001C7CEB97|nr:hypothetical protein [Apilactobacillus zhangqiuensis]